MGNEISKLEGDVRNLLYAIQRGLIPEEGMDVTRLEDAVAYDEWKDHYAFPVIARAMLARKKPHLVEPLWMICQMQERIERLRLEKHQQNACQKPQNAPGCARGIAPVVDGPKEPEGPITKMVANGAESEKCDGNDRWWETE